MQTSNSQTEVLTWSCESTLLAGFIRFVADGTIPTSLDWRGNLIRLSRSNGKEDLDGLLATSYLSLRVIDEEESTEFWLSRNDHGDEDDDCCGSGDEGEVRCRAEEVSEEYPEVLKCS